MVWQRALTFGMLGFVAAGCAELPPPERTYQTQAFGMASSDSMADRASAENALGLLKDNSAFPLNKVARLTVTKDSVEVDGFLRTYESALSVGYGTAALLGRNALGYSVGLSRMYGTTQREQRVLWFADVDGVAVEHVVEFHLLHQADAPKSTYANAMDGYYCTVTMRNAQPVVFWSASPTYTKRVASAFALLSGKKVGTVTAYPAAGSLFRQEDCAVVDELVGGPFDLGQIPPGAKIERLDGKAYANCADLVDTLTKLPTGKHVVSYRILPNDGFSWFDPKGEGVITIKTPPPPSFTP